MYVVSLCRTSSAELLSNQDSLISHFHSAGRARLDSPSLDLFDHGLEIPLRSYDTQSDQTIGAPLATNKAHGLYGLGNERNEAMNSRSRTSQNNDIQLAVKITDDDVLSNESEERSKFRKNFVTLKTGTTIVGVKTPTSIIIAADTRATEGSVVADKLCQKVHQLSQNIWCCGAGTSADLDALTRKIRYTFLLKSMILESIGNNGAADDSMNMYTIDGVEEDIGYPLGQASMADICNMIRESLYKSGGEIGANLVLGGFDPCTDQPILTAIHPHGSIDVIPYTALGSGGLAAMGILESRYNVNLSLDEGIQLVKDAVKAGIENDLGSGSQIDLCILSKEGVKYQRGVSLEQSLPRDKGDQNIDKMLLLEHILRSSAHSMNGVNGFGTVPYRIKSQVKVMEDESFIERNNREWIKNIID